MTLRRKISLVLLAAGVLPVAVIGVLSYRTSRDEATALVRHAQEQTAQQPKATVLAEQPQSAATRVRNQTLLGALIGLAVAIALSLWLERGVWRPLAELKVAARALSEGRYDAVTPNVEGTDELAELAGTFRRMAIEIRLRDEEIKGWNRELEVRVKAGTAELKEAQEQILRSRRLAALGSLGAGIAHELNNPLAAVIGLAGLAQLQLGGSPGEAASSLKELIDQAKRMRQIIDRLRTLAEAERDAAGARFELAEPVLHALELYAMALAAQKIVLSTSIEASLPEVQGWVGQVMELVCHLVDNALHAMPDGGRLGVSISTVDRLALKLTVSDTGVGIPASIRERIFDPFFTAKQDPARAGVGLGLSTVHRIVERHHGSLAVSSEAGKGSTFTVVLPAASEEPHLS